jgi:hypothetical protein
MLVVLTVYAHLVIGFQHFLNRKKKKKTQNIELVNYIRIQREIF